MKKYVKPIIQKKCIMPVLNYRADSDLTTCHIRERQLKGHKITDDRSDS